MARKNKGRQASVRAPSRDIESHRKKRDWRWLPDRARWAVVALLAATMLAYVNGLSGPFIFDDSTSISGNPTIRSIWPFGTCQPPCALDKGATVNGRPLLNFSFAFNYALGGLAVQGYHALNLAIHMANALLLFGVVRRTLSLAAIRDRIGGAAVTLAFAIALLWAVHPLQTESVTYIVQRAESLVSLFYLLTLYCVIRGAGSGKPAMWYSGAVVACLLGMSAKEVMVTAPVIVLLYDRMFLAGTFKEALIRRPWLYAGMALTWLLLAYLVASMGALVAMYSGYQGPRGSSTIWSYAATQPGVILHYLRLTVWPDPLVLDYGWPVAKSAGDVVPASTVILALLAVTVWGLLARKAWGFLGAWFFLILSPTSSVVPLADDFIFEHRMYLALAAPLTAIVLAGYFGSKELASRGLARKLIAPATGLGVLIVLATLLGVLTHQRNKDYASGLSIWQDTVAKAPGNSRAHDNLGLALGASGKLEEAINHYRESLRLRPSYSGAHNNMAVTLVALGRPDDAIHHHREALKLRPNSALMHDNLGITLAAIGKDGEAISLFREALRLDPYYSKAHVNLANALAAKGRLSDATAHYREAIRLKPDYPEAHVNLGAMLSREGRHEEAIAHFREALSVNASFSVAHANLGSALASRGRLNEGLSHLREALRLDPQSVEGHKNICLVLSARGQVAEAIDHCQAALRIHPESANAHFVFGKVFSQAGRMTDAVAQYREALRLNPNSPEVHNDLGAALAGTGMLDEAIAQYRRALKLNPAYAEAHYNLGKALAQKGQSVAAIEQYRKALRYRPEFSAAHNNLGNALAEIGQREKAIVHLQESLRIEPAYVWAHYNLANILASVNREDEAIGHYREALRLSPDFAQAHNNLGAVLAGKGRAEEAKEHFSMALRINPNLVDAKRALEKLAGARK